MPFDAHEDLRFRRQPPRCYARAQSVAVESAFAQEDAVLVVLAMLAAIAMILFVYLNGGLR
jgi:hypothetical protein